MIEVWLRLTLKLGTWLMGSTRSSYQVWGAHLLEDWKSLSLLAERER